MPGDDYFKTIKFKHNQSKEGKYGWTGEIHFHYDIIIIYTYDSEKVYALHPIWVLDTSIPHVLVKDILIIENNVMEATKVYYALGGMEPNKQIKEEAFRQALQKWLANIETGLATIIASTLDDHYAFLGEQTDNERPLLEGNTMSGLDSRTIALLENMRDHLRDPKGRSDMETGWFNEIDIILGVKCEHCLFGGWIIATAEDDQEFASIARCTCQEGDAIHQSEAENRAAMQTQIMKALFLQMIDAWPEVETNAKINGADAVDWLVQFIKDAKDRLGI